MHEQTSSAPLVIGAFAFGMGGKVFC